jgi:ComF family protein
VDRARAIGPYDGALRAIVHTIKYEGRRSLAKPLGRMLRTRAADLIEGVDAVVPVPLHRSRRRERGFNQAMDLARHIGPAVVPALRRVRATPSQTGLSAAQRRLNVRAAFDATKAARLVKGSTVMLIDDVSTTGATLDACARALKEAGVREVRALTVARVVTPPR